MMSGVGFGMFGIGWLIMMGFWVFAVGGAVWLVATLAHGNQIQPVTSPANETPWDTLKVRYAKGEIAKEQFEQSARQLDV